MTPREFDQLIQNPRASIPKRRYPAAGRRRKAQRPHYFRPVQRHRKDATPKLRNT